MRLSSITVSLLSIALAACGKGKPEHKPAPAGAQSGSAKPDLVLPRSDGSPIKPTAGKIDQATLERIQAMTFPGFATVPRDLDANRGAVNLQLRSKDHPIIWVLADIVPCASPGVLGACVPMELSQWNSEPKYSQIKSILPADLRAQEDTIFEVGSTELDGQKMIYQYQLGQSSSHPSAPDAVGSAFNPGGFSYSNAYFLYYNDGVNQIRVVAEFKDDPQESKDKMAELVPKTDLENVAKAFMDIFTHTW